MTITVVVTKTKLAIAVLAMALFVPATAMALDSWSDTQDGAFYHDAVTWAKGNGMTVGCNDGTAFCPARTVTRGENITFAHRYDTKVVQPALTALENRVATLEAAQPFAVTARNDSADVMPGGGNFQTVAVSVSVTAPVDGHVSVNSTTEAFDANPGSTVRCTITTADSQVSADASGYRQSWKTAGATGNGAQLAGTRVFSIEAGATETYNLVCDRFGSGLLAASVVNSTLTAIFTPAP